jgi:hypothetical protein
MVDPSHHFVPGDDGVLAEAPFVVDDAQVAVADAAIVDVDLHFIRLQLARVVLEWFEHAFRFIYSIGVDHLASPRRTLAIPTVIQGAVHAWRRPPMLVAFKQTLNTGFLVGPSEMRFSAQFGFVPRVVYSRLAT